VLEIAAATAAPAGRRVRVAGITLCRQRPATAQGMIFLTIEDESAAANIVVRPDVWAAADHAARRAAVLVVEGRIQRRGAVVHVVATRLESALGAPPRSAPESGSPAGTRAAASAEAAGPPAAEFAPRPPALAALPRMSRDFC
jgi:DNA polymerase III alpha subunit